MKDYIKRLKKYSFPLALFIVLVVVFYNFLYFNYGNCSENQDTRRNITAENKKPPPKSTKQPEGKDADYENTIKELKDSLSSNVKEIKSLKNQLTDLQQKLRKTEASQAGRRSSQELAVLVILIVLIIAILFFLFWFLFIRRQPKESEKTSGEYKKHYNVSLFNELKQELTLMRSQLKDLASAKDIANFCHHTQELVNFFSKEVQEIRRLTLNKISVSSDYQVQRPSPESQLMKEMKIQRPEDIFIQNYNDFIDQGKFQDFLTKYSAKRVQINNIEELKSGGGDYATDYKSTLSIHEHGKLCIVFLKDQVFLVPAFPDGNSYSLDQYYIFKSCFEVVEKNKPPDRPNTFSISRLDKPGICNKINETEWRVVTKGKVSIVHRTVN
jgi:uncharacterized coiled-coil protein SlyX